MFARAAPESNTRRAAAGTTLLDLMLAIVVAAILGGIAYASYARYLDRLKVGRAEDDIYEFQQAIERFRSQNWRLPQTLAEVNLNTKLDPWGRAYYYQPFLTPRDFKNARKDKHLHPLNTDFDLYSAGKDGLTKLPLTAKASQDDVLRANNGAFVGLASDY